MSRLRSFLASGLFVVALSAGCGKSPPAVAPSNNVVQQDVAGSTDPGTAPYQPNAGANQASPTTPSAVSPPSVAPPTAGITPPSPASADTVAPTAVSPPSVGPLAPSSGQGAAATAAPGVVSTPAPPAAGNLPPADNGAAPGAMAAGDTRGLAAAVNQSRQEGKSLVGVKRFDDKPVGAGNSWMIQLLPYVGYSDLYAKFDFSKGWHEKENLAYACQVIPAFLDPGNPNHNMQIVGKTNAIGPAFTHIVGMAGVEDSRNLVAASLARSDPRAGIFGYDQIARPEEITDGAANTIMLISAGKVVGAWAAGGGSTIRAARAPYFDPITGFGTAREPGGGALVAMADGSIKRISKDIDPAVFRALCTIHGGETVDLSTNASIRSE